MNCKDVQEALLNYYDRSLDAADREEIKDHLETCNGCREEVKEWGELLEVIGDAPQEKPGPALRESFHSLLQSELNLQTMAGLLKETPDSAEVPVKKRSIFSPTSPVWKLAAAVILMLGGFWMGKRAKPPAASSEPITALRNEVKEMKEVLLFSLLDDESASQRLKAVSYAEDMPNPDQKVIVALVNTLNHDKNVNVRLASLYSLARFTDNHSVRDSLVASLAGQTEPLIQVVLINILAEKKEHRAIAPIRDILSKEKGLKEVREAAEKGLKKI
jgi:hypothetical protein